MENDLNNNTENMNTNTEVKTNIETGSKNNSKKVIIGVVAVILIIAISVGVVFLLKGKDITGTYKLTEMVDNGETTSSSDLALLEGLGYKMTLELKEDKTGILNLYGEEIELKYDDKNISYKNESYSYKVDGDKLILENDGSKLVFQKEK